MENARFISIGYGNIISVQRVVAIVSADSAPVKRIMQDAKEKGLLIDATCGRKTRSVIIMDSGHVVLSTILPDTMINRLNLGTLNDTDLKTGD